MKPGQGLKEVGKGKRGTAAEVGRGLKEVSMGKGTLLVTVRSARPGESELECP